MFAYIFGKPVNDEFTRYWASISTEIVDSDGEGTGEYYHANVEVKLSKKAREVFEDNAAKTSGKKIVGANFELVDFWLKAGKPYEDEDGNEVERLILFINKLDIPEQPKKRAKKAAGAKKKPSDDEEDA